MVASSVIKLLIGIPAASAGLTDVAGVNIAMPFLYAAEAAAAFSVQKGTQMGVKKYVTHHSKARQHPGPVDIDVGHSETWQKKMCSKPMGNTSRKKCKG